MQTGLKSYDVAAHSLSSKFLPKSEEKIGIVRVGTKIRYRCCTLVITSHPADKSRIIYCDHSIQFCRLLMICPHASISELASHRRIMIFAAPLITQKH